MNLRAKLTYPFVVAEMGANHMGDLDRAIAIVQAASDAGADAVKLQTFAPDTMLVRGAQHRIQGGLWDGQDLWELYDKCALPWSWHKAIFEHGQKLGIMVYSSPFDRVAVDFLERLGCPMYKIASFEILDVELIRLAASTGKPLVISTGMATLEEIEYAVEAATAGGCKRHNLTLLKCTSAYPAQAQDTNLATMDNLRERFRCQVGLSDHTRGTGVAVAAALRGADMIEKHMGHFRTTGPDESFSLDPIGMEDLVRSVRDAVDSIGTEQYGPTAAEAPMLALRRTLHVARNLQAGEQLKEEDIVARRPAGGLPPAAKAELVGRLLTRDVSAGEALTWDLVRGEKAAI